MGLSKQKSLRRRWFSRFVLFVLFGLLFLVSPVRDVAVKYILEQQVSIALGERVWIPDCTTTLWPPQLNIQGLQIGDAEQTIVQLQRLDINFQLEEDRPWVQSIEAHEPVVVLPFDEDGLIPFRKRIRGNKPLTKLPFEHLRVINASVAIEKGDLRGSAQNLNIDFHRRSGTFSVALDPVQIKNRTIHVAPIKFDFAYTPGDFSLPELSVEAEGLQIEGFVRVTDTIDSRLQITGEFPEVLRGKKIHLKIK